MHNIMFTDEAVFHVNGCINQRNCQMWGSEKPHVTHEFVHDSPNLNMWCELMHDLIFGPFAVAETETINGMFLSFFFFRFLKFMIYPMLATFICSSSPHDVLRATLGKIFPNIWIGRSGPILWPPRSPSLTFLDFFSSGVTSRTLCVQKK
jgi:hypothetical protein